VPAPQPGNEETDDNEEVGSKGNDSEEEEREEGNEEVSYEGDE
jgi:hypothetical protein